MKDVMFNYQTEDGLALGGKLYLPDTKPTKAVIHAHGWGDTHKKWQDETSQGMIPYLARGLTTLGYAFLTVDNRGRGIDSQIPKASGGYARIGSRYEIFEDFEKDMRAQLTKLQEMGCSAFVLEGHSTGANKVADYQSAARDKTIKAVAFLSPCDDFGLQKDFLGGEQAFLRSLENARKLVDAGRPREVMPGPGEFRSSAESYLSAFGPGRNAGLFQYQNGNFGRLEMIEVPMLAVFGENDDYQKNPAPKEALTMLEIIPNVSTRIIDGANHRFSGKEKQLARAVSNWLKELHA